MTPDADDFIHNHTKAVTNLLLGNRKMKPGFAICGGKPLDVDGHIRIAQMAKMSDADVVHLEFGTLANHGYGMTGISVILVRESKCFVQTGCQLWLGEIGNRAVILPRPESRGHFRLSPREIIHIDGKPAENAAEGICRAEAWVEQRMRSNAAMPDNAEFLQRAGRGMILGQGSKGSCSDRARHRAHAGRVPLTRSRRCRSLGLHRIETETAVSVDEAQI